MKPELKECFKCRSSLAIAGVGVRTDGQFVAFVQCGGENCDAVVRVEVESNVELKPAVEAWNSISRPPKAMDFLGVEGDASILEMYNNH